MLGLINALRFGFDMLERSQADLLALCAGCDLIVVPASVAAGKNEAELLKIPSLIQAYLYGLFIRLGETPKKSKKRKIQVE